MDLRLAIGEECLVGLAVSDGEEPLRAVPEGGRLREAAEVVLAVARRDLVTTDGGLAVVIKEGPNHRPCGVRDGIGRVRAPVRLGASRVERLLDALVVRVVLKGFAPLVLVAEGVARAALAQVDWLVRQLGVARVELLARLVRKALCKDRMREAVIEGLRRSRDGERYGEITRLDIDCMREEVVECEHIAKGWPRAVKLLCDLLKAWAALLARALAAVLVAE